MPFRLNNILFLLFYYWLTPIFDIEPKFKTSSNRWRLSFLLSCLHVFLGHGKHKLYSVFLINLSCAGVVIHRHNISHGVGIPDFPYHTLAHNMVWKAPEGLCTYNIAVALLNKLHHLGCKQPALTHFAAVADYGLHQLL